MKRRISLLLAVVMVLGSFAAFAATDVELEKAKFLESNKVLLGNTAGDLLLDENMKRQDSVVMLSRLLGKESEAKETKESEAFGKFTDTPKNDKYYNGFISWALENEFFVGHTAERFGYNENITARDYSVVLLRALGYGKEAEGAEGWKSAYTTANTLGLLKDVTAKEADEITRGQMAVMTFNALGTKVKGSDKTLAETLGITMPASDKLTAEVKDTASLAEVIVELSNASLVNKDKAELASNYKIDGFAVKMAKLDGNNVILTLEKALTKNKEYKLTVRGIDKAINKDYTFKAFDNSIPEVVSATGLGEKGIKVVTTEVIKNPLERNFTIGGKRISMNIEQYGRVIILTPYYNQDFPSGDQKLTIEALEDYAGYKSVSQDFDITIEKDNEGPKIVDSTVSGNRVTVTFDKSIYKNSVAKYESRRSLGNASYTYRGTTFYTTGADKVDDNKVVYTFERDLRTDQDVDVKDVQNHSRVAMKAEKVSPRLVKDDVAPFIVNNNKIVGVPGEYVDNKLDKTTTFVIEFDKDMENFDAKNARDHFALAYKHREKGTGYSIAKGAEIDNFIEVKQLDKKNEFEVTLLPRKTASDDRFTKNNADKDYDYVLEVFGLKATTGAKMEDDYIDFELVAKGTDFVVNTVTVARVTGDSSEVVVTFNKALDKASAEDETNYLFTKDGKVRDLKELKGDVFLESDGKKVTLRLPFSVTELEKYELEVLRSVKNKDGERLAPNQNFDLGNANVIATAEEALAKLADYAKVDGVTKDNLEAARAAVDKAEKAIAAYDGKASDLKGYENLAAAKANIKKVEDADVQTADEKKLAEAKAAVEKIQVVLQTTGEADTEDTAKVNIEKYYRQVAGEKLEGVTVTIENYEYDATKKLGTFKVTLSIEESKAAPVSSVVEFTAVDPVA